ncbi:MAG: hypothetical protein KIT60_06115 [Burkholderiaceae bacterium]|nr:hypothetical protein [Burkholderiaceae bacterium]
MLHILNLPSWTTSLIRTLALVIALPAALALTACERFEHKGPVPTYHDSKLDAMRSVTDQPLPTSHERSAITSDSDKGLASSAAAATSSAPASAARTSP